MINNSDFGGFIVSNNILEGKPIRYTFRDQSIIPPLNGWNLLSIEDDEEYLYWYSIQGENGIRVEESDSWIDKKHLEYWDECIDKNYYVEMSMQVSMISHHIANLMTGNSIAR